MKLTSIALGLAIAVASSTGAAQKESKKESKLDKVLRVQVLLDRANISSGEIDGTWGKNAKGALNAFQEALGLPITEEADEQTLLSLEQVSGNVFLREYTITPEDVAGPYVAEIPTDLVEQSKLPQLAYRDIREMLGERFHCDPELLKKLNPKAQYAAGEIIQVPNVLEGTELIVQYPEPKKSEGADDESSSEKKKRDTEKESSESSDTGTTSSNSSAKKAAKAALVVVSKSASSLMAMDDQNRLMFYAPVTSGSEHDPLPIGEWKVNGSDKMPSFNYNPELFWDANPEHTKAKIPPGPNNPVGVVWVDISKEHYGLHGTPEPGKIGYTQSHGCVRLANWDAMRLSNMVKPGVKVLFVE
jgi:lipoprotein-anchoring transpeptidase ErfK/SrfK